MKTPSDYTLTSNLLQYPFLLLPSISVRTKEKVSLEMDKENSEQGMYTELNADYVNKGHQSDQTADRGAAVPVVFGQRSPVDALWETEESDRL